MHTNTQLTTKEVYQPIHHRIYLISNPSTNTETALTLVNQLISGVETSFPTAVRQPPWTLQYRVFRGTLPSNYHPPTDAQGTPIQYAHTFQHMLHLSSLEPNRTFICTQPPAGTSTVSAIPLNQQDSHISLLRNALAALWQPRHALFIQAGTIYAGGVCTVQIAELRSKRDGAQSGAVQSPGVVVCISTAVGPDESDGITAQEEDALDFGDAQTIIREFWARIKIGKDLGKADVREIMMAPKYVQGLREKDAVARMWCDVLRLRG